MKNSKILLLLLFIVLVQWSTAQSLKPEPAYKLKMQSEYIVSKNYYLLALLQGDNPAKTLLIQDSVLSGILHAKTKKIKDAIASCKTASCYMALFKWSNEEIE